MAAAAADPVKMAFAALDETARVIRGQQTVAKLTKGKTAAVWHALMFAAVSKSITKMQAVKEQLQAWIKQDFETAVPILLGEAQNKEDAAAATAAAAEQQQQQQQQQQQVSRKRITDEAAVLRICDSFQALKQIAHATTVIFEVIESSKTNKLDIKREMLSGYRQNVFLKVDDLLFDYIVGRVDACRAGEDIMSTGATGLLARACRMFLTMAKQHDTEAEQREYYGEKFVRRYHDHALRVARQNFADFVRQPGALGGLLTWAEERIAFETKLATLFINQDETGIDTRFSLRRFQIQLEQFFVVPLLEDVLRDPATGFASALAAGRTAVLRQQYAWVVKLRSSCPRTVPLVTEALERYAAGRVEAVCSAFSETTHDTAAAAATSICTNMFAVMKELFGEILSSVSGTNSNSNSNSSSGGDADSAQLAKPIRRAIANVLSRTQLTRKVLDPARKQTNESTDHFAELLVTYIDIMLRDGQLPSGFESIHDVARGPVRDCLDVIDDRDIFLEHYKLRLARRLLTTAWKEDNEHSLLEVLQKVGGRTFTHKLEGMIFDLQAAAEQQKFEEYCASTFKGGSGDADSFNPARMMDVSVLTAAFWPPVKGDDFVPPRALRMCLDAFERYYLRVYPRRQLRWQAERGTAQLLVSFPRGLKEVACSLYQAAVMLTIDEAATSSSGTITAGEIATVLHLDPKVVLAQVASMLLAKGLNLVQRTGVESEQARLAPTDALSMNGGYVSRMRRLKLPTAVLAATADKGAVADQIEPSRALAIDGAVVRIMKSRKTLDSRELIELAMQQTQRWFVAQPKQVKLRIDFLISKDYLARDKEDFSILHYLA